MMKPNRLPIMVTILISLLVIFLVIGNQVVQAQEDAELPVRAVSSSEIALVQTQGTPESPTAQTDPTAAATPEASASPTPVPYPAPSGEIADALDDIDGQTVLNLVFSFVVVALVAIFGSRLIYSLLRRLTRRSKTDIDNLLLESVKPLIGWLIAAIGFQLATSRLDFLSDAAREILAAVYFIIYLFVAISATWRIGDAAVDMYVEKRREQLDENLVNQIVPLLKRLSHIALVFIGVIVLAGYFGLSVLSISAALGLTGFAIALAAQDTIANIISGMVIMFDGPFRIGDRIDVGDLGTWGDVVEIGIRSSKVVTRDNRLVIVPNSQIVDSAVVNYSMPDTTYRLESDIGIGYGMDIATVQRLIKKTVRDQEGVLPDKPIDVWFIEFGDSSMTFRVRWWVQSYAEKRRSTDRINAAIQELAERESIEMPNVTYTLDNQIALSDEDVQKIAKALNGPKVNETD